MVREDGCIRWMFSCLVLVGAPVLTSYEKARMEVISALTSDMQNSPFFFSNRLEVVTPLLRVTEDTEFLPKNLVGSSKPIKKNFLFAQNKHTSGEPFSRGIRALTVANGSACQSTIISFFCWTEEEIAAQRPLWKLSPILLTDSVIL